MRVDYNESHAFRPEAKGYSQWAMVVPDDPMRPYREVEGQVIYRPRPFPTAMQTKDMADSDLWRFQYANWRYQLPTLTASGEVVDDPLKMLDDAGNLTQMWYSGAPLQGTSLTHEQKIKLIVPQAVQEAVATATTADSKWIAGMDLEFQREIAEQQLRPEQDRWEDEFE